jgi:glycine cleavage system H protein
MKYGAMDYIEKPFTEDELRMFVKLALIKRRDRIEKQLKPRVQVLGPAEAEQGSAAEFTVPGGVLVSPGHCWASLAQDGTANIGVDDFARKLLGRVDAFELPEVGRSVRAGQGLFTLRQGNRQVQFNAPLSGKVASVNRELRRDPGMFKDYPYGKNWICVVTAEDLDAELPKLKIGKSAVTFFQEEIERFRAFLQKLSGDEIPDPATFCIGALEKLDDAHWEAAVSEFFAR